MDGPEIIKEIFKICKNTYVTKYYIIKYELLYNEIFNNFKLYGNEPISDIDPDHVWLKSTSSNGFSCPVYDTDENGKIDYNSENFIFCVKYICSKTKEVGYTFQYKSYIIKPFLIIKHDWENIIENDSPIMKFEYYKKYILYKCKECSCLGKRQLGTKDILSDVPDLTCNEIIIKDIVE